MFVKRNFHPGEFLLEYPAEIVSEEDATKREEEYQKRNEGCFIYYLNNKNGLTW